LIKLKDILKEKVDISKISDIESGLRKKYGDNLGPMTFGIEFEFAPNVKYLDINKDALSLELKNKNNFEEDYEDLPSRKQTKFIRLMN